MNTKTTNKQQPHPPKLRKSKNNGSLVAYDKEKKRICVWQKEWREKIVHGLVKIKFHMVRVPFFPVMCSGQSEIATFLGISLGIIKCYRISPHFSHSTLTRLVQIPLVKSGSSGIWATSCPWNRGYLHFTTGRKPL